MSSKSSISRPLPLGRVAGFRGNEGEVTVRILSGQADRWVGLKKVLLSGPGDSPEGPGTEWAVDRSRAYRDRLVLKLHGVDDAGTAERLRGLWIVAPAEDVPVLPEGEYYMDRLMGLEVVDLTAGPLGIVADVVETGGVDLLLVRNEVGREILVPLARDIVTDVSEAEGKIRVRTPQGLLEEMD